MVARVLTGSKQEIARKVVDLEGEVREAVVFVEESTGLGSGCGGDGGSTQDAADIFVEMQPHMVHVQDVDDSREALYSRQDGE